MGDDGELIAPFEDRRVRTLARLAELLGAPLLVQERLERLARIVVPGLSDACVIELADRGEPRLALVHHERAERARSLSADRLRLCHGTERVLRTGASERYEAAPVSGIAVALPGRAHTIGVLTLLAESNRLLGDAELALAEEIAGLAGVAIEHASLHEEERKARVASEEVVESTARLYSFTAGLAQALTPRDVAQVVTSLGCDVVGAQAAWVSAVSTLGPDLELLAATGFSAGFVSANRRVALDADAAGAAAIRDGITRWLGSAEECAAFDPSLAAVTAASGGEALAVVPMTSRGVPTGLVGFSFAERRGFDEGKRSQITALVRQATEALERARLFELERAARGEAERAARQRAALQALTAHLSRAITVNEVAQILVEEGKGALGALAGWVSLLAEDGVTLELRAESGYESSFVETYRRIPVGADLAVAQVVRDGKSRWFESVRSAETHHPELAAGEVATGAEALAAVPLAGRGSTFGFLALRFAEAREFGEADRALLTTLASQAAQAVERARMYEAEHTVAQTLQRSLLPPMLPTLRGAQAAVRYLAAAEHAEAGGDWYDVLQLPDGRIGLAVGDVVGHGADAAAVMGQLRSALRAYALTRVGPSKALRRLSQYAADLEGALAATAAYVVLDPESGLLRFARAGHPPPLLLPANGKPRYLDGPAGAGTPLACDSFDRLRDGRLVLGRDDVLLLYSDGAVERRGESIEGGLQRLAEAVAELATDDPAALCDALLERLFETAPPRDDVVLLALRLRPPAEGELGPLVLQLAAEAEALAGMRHELRPWLSEAGAAPETIEAITLACHEACSNAIEHGYRGVPGGVVHVELRVEREGVELTVSDEGRWQPPVEAPDERGRGLELMRGLMDAIKVHPGPQGTSVWMRTRLRPPG